MLNPNTLHLAFIYSFSLLHLFMVHHGLLQGSKFLPVFQQLALLSAYCSMFTGSVHFKYRGFLNLNIHRSLVLFTCTDLAPSFVPFILHIDVLYHTQFTYKISILNNSSNLNTLTFSTIFNRASFDITFQLYIFIIYHS